MTNPIRDIHLFLVKKGKVGDLITVAYSKGNSGMVRAFHGYGDRTIGKAGGGGYDKIHTALQEAIEFLYEVKLDSNGAAGFHSVEEGAKKHGITVINVLADAYRL